MKKTIIKIIKRTMLTLLAIIVLLVIATAIFIQRPEFGKHPSGERLERIQRSPNFKNGQFVNISPTPDLTEGVSYYAVMKEFIFGKSERNRPIDSMPSGKIDLHHLDPNRNILVWFGHSSYFMQIDGKKILVDPIFSGAASPVGFTTKSYKGSDVYTADDMPEIDYLLISHDHWDHLDYQTITKLKPKIKKVVCGLGVGAHFEYWGFHPSLIQEKDWGEKVELETDFTIIATPARHFSGRGFSRNRALWASYVMISRNFRIYVGGDSGYDRHFSEIGEEYGPFDLVLLECGQYDKSWKYIHMMPEEVVTAAKDLKAKKLMPVHWAKFSLGNHAWDDPILRVVKAGMAEQMPLVTPLIGELVDIRDSVSYPPWWQKIR